MVEVRIGRRRMRIVRPLKVTSSPCPQRDVLPLVVFGGSVADHRLGDGHLAERDIGHRAVRDVDPHQHRLAALPPAALHRQVHVVGYRVHGHVADVDVVGLAAEVGTDPRVHVGQVERLRRGRRAGVGDVNRQDPGRGIVGQEQDPGRTEGNRPRGLHLR